MIKVFQVDWHVRVLNTAQVVLIIEHAFDSVVTFVNTPLQADIILIGPYGNNHCAKNVQSAKGWKLFVTYEPVIPDYRYYHHSLSFCFDDFGGRNFRYPVWWLSLTLFAKQTGGTYDHSTSERILYENAPLQLIHDDRKRKCVTIFNKCEPRRMYWSHILGEEQILDGFGAAFGCQMPWGDESGYQAKHKTLTGYRVNLCPENTIMDGYYTEKVLHARVAGCVPLTCVDTHVSRDFDVGSLVNIYANDDWKSEIQRILVDDAVYFEKVNRPILTENPNLLALATFINSSYSDYRDGKCDDGVYPEFDFSKYRPSSALRDSYVRFRKFFSL